MAPSSKIGTGREMVNVKKMKGDEMGGTCRAHVRDEKCKHFIRGKLKEETT
jgi:hypothetical protein